MDLGEALAYVSMLSAEERLTLVEKVLCQIEAIPSPTREALDQALDRSLAGVEIDPETDPVATELREAVADMTAQLIEAKKVVATAIARERAWAKRAETAAVAAAEWGRRARLATMAGDPALVNEALAKQREGEGEAQELREAHEAQRADVQIMKQRLRELHAKIEQTRHEERREVVRLLRARTRRALELVERLVRPQQGAGQT